MADTQKAAVTATTDKPAGSSDFVSANRETIESIIVAIILALLFRAFIAEAFVIPTGSMAPTLMGRHVDVWCDQCQYHFQASGSAERDRNDQRTRQTVSHARCPNCGAWKPLDYTAAWSNDRTFSGDRIIVSKSAYDLGEPQRWDVIVFKYPEAAQTNYIKRLIGLPNEQIRIEGGNIYVKKPQDEQFAIARKTDDNKLLAMLQLVHDSDHPSALLEKENWPAWWQPHQQAQAWTADEQATSYSLATTPDDAWLRYHHVYPEPNWETLETTMDNRPISEDWRGGLISDTYGYNCNQVVNDYDPEQRHTFSSELSPAFGQYWVDDLAAEAEVELTDATGDVLFDIVRAGVHYVARIDAKTGAVELTARDADGKPVAFGVGQASQETVTGQSGLQGAGTYQLRMSNVDHEIRLWVNGRRVKFEGPTTYESAALVYPDLDSADGDLAPIGVGGRNQAMEVRHLKVLRDKYYIAYDTERRSDSEYRRPPTPHEDRNYGQQEIVHLLAHPTPEELLPMLQSRISFNASLEENQFMPLGDNSPASSDARYWEHPYVGRHLMVGKALFIYWPHTWNSPPFLPNFRRMQPIR